ncbi:MAG: hypothetical protein PHN61_13250 [Methanothrix sp.]|nr:hypothetical protein [Methanothrix sp.]
MAVLEVILNDYIYILNYIGITILLILISIIVYEVLTRRLSKIIKFFIILTALLLTAGGILSLLAGMMKFNCDVINFWHTDIENYDEVFIKLIHLAE